jgi:sugar phosphate permease
METQVKAKAETSTHSRNRYRIVAVIWLALFVSGFDRAAVSLLLTDAAFLRDMDIAASPEKQGLIMTFLLLPYAFSNIILGPAVDRWGPRKILTWMTLCWSAAAVWMGAISTYAAMLAGRLVRGTAEGPLFPVANRFIHFWFPQNNRGIANALWISGQRVGLTLAVPLLAAAIGVWGWRAALFLQAVPILLLVVPAVWFLTADNPPGTVNSCGASAKRKILPGLPKEQKGAEKGALSGLMRNHRFWLMVMHHFAVLACFSGLTTWLPKYLREERGFDVGYMVLFASLPYLGSFLSSLIFGFISDRIGHRALLCTLSLAGAAVSIGLAAFVSNSHASVALMILGMVLWGIGPPIYYAIMQRIIPSSIMATGIGIDNGLANLGSALAPFLIGILIAATGSYVAGLLFITVTGLIGASGTAVLAMEE